VAEHEELRVPVSLRVPAGVHADLIAYARARGSNLSAVVNEILVEAHPAVRDWLRKRRATLANGK
jgi:hypothetical protein